MKHSMKTKIASIAMAAAMATAMAVPTFAATPVNNIDLTPKLPSYYLKDIGMKTGNDALFNAGEALSDVYGAVAKEKNSVTQFIPDKNAQPKTWTTYKMTGGTGDKKLVSDKHSAQPGYNITNYYVPTFQDAQNHFNKAVNSLVNNLNK